MQSKFKRILLSIRARSRLTRVDSARKSSNRPAEHRSARDSGSAVCSMCEFRQSEARLHSRAWIGTSFDTRNGDESLRRVRNFHRIAYAITPTVLRQIKLTIGRLNELGKLEISSNFHFSYTNADRGTRGQISLHLSYSRKLQPSHLGKFN